MDIFLLHIAVNSKHILDVYHLYLLQDWLAKVARPAVGGTISLLGEIVKDFMEVATEVVRVIVRAVQGNPSWLVVSS